MLSEYDEALFLAVRELGKSSSENNSEASSLAKVSLGCASRAAIKRASKTAEQYRKVVALPGSTLLSAKGSIVSNTANVIGNAIISKLRQDLNGKLCRSRS